ncbi:MAG: hypothetical protein KatS3mg035_0495 [Bacteroidia bacterium]|nr:MAG: hypothetical protein KatS3mg035_0495 [Bacteroidia bacterium]
MYWAGGTGRSISTGYTGLISHDPTSGQMQFRVGQTNAGAANTVVTANTAVVINRTGEVGIGTTTPAASARLEVNDPNRGILIPRVSLVARNNNAPIGAGIVNSLLVYNTATSGTAPNNVTPGYYYWNATAGLWMRLYDGGNGSWDLGGNTLTGTLPASPNEFIGTINNADWIIRTNNLERARVTAGGNVGIGTTTPTSKLQVVDEIINDDNFNPNVSGGKLGGISVYDNTDFIGISTVDRDGNTVTTDDADGMIYWGDNAGAGNDDNLRFTQMIWTGTTMNWTERMRITSNGDVGIGTTTPAVRLHVNGAGRFDDALILFRPSDGTNAAMLNMFNPGTGRYWHHVVRSGDNDKLQWHRWNGANWLHVMTMDLNGYVGIGTTAPLVPLEVRKNIGYAPGTGGSSHAPTSLFVPNGGGGFWNDWINGWGGGISTWDIVGASTLMTGYVTRSDRSYKTRVQSIGLQPDFVQKFMKLNPVTYYFNRETIAANEWDYQRLHYGFIANEVEEIFPDIVVNAGMDSSIKRGLEYDAFIPMLVKMVQEQQKMIENLNKEIRSLKEQLQK